MDRSSLHLEIRNAISISDELSRHEHALGQDELSGCLAGLRGALSDLERDVGRSHDDVTAPDAGTVEAVERALQSLIIRRYEVPRALRARTEQLLGSAERVSIALWDPTERVPSKPLLGKLPLARLIPQDIHSVLDYVHAAGFLLSARLAITARGRAVGLALGAGLGGTSAVTDYRLSGAKLLPIELHESLDYATGLAAIAAPFVLGYAKRDPLAAMIQIGLGIGTLVTSALTDYRAERGVTRPLRSHGGPQPTREVALAADEGGEPITTRRGAADASHDLPGGLAAL